VEEMHTIWDSTIDLISPIDLPKEHSSDITNDYDKHLNAIPTDTPWYIDEMPNANEPWEPNSFYEGRSGYQCKKLKLSDKGSK
jgi:hypothetical protein